jgi:MFS family permease
MTSIGAGTSGGEVPRSAAVRVPKESAGFGTLLLPLLIGQALVTADFTCMNSMIGDIAHDLGSSLTGLQTTMALSFLVMGAFIIPASRIGGRRGHARVLALGAAILAVGDLISGLSPALPVLLIGKALIAAVGSALIVPAVFSLATLHYEGATRKRALGLINVQLGVGTIAGAFIGGWLATNASWRWWFAVEVAIGVVLVVLMRPHFEEGMQAKVSEFDVLGTLLSFVGLLLIVLGFIQASAFGFIKARQDFHLFGVKLLSKGGLSPMLPIVALGLLFLVAFAFLERRRIAAGKEPLVHLAVLGDRAVRAGGAALALNFAIMGAGLYVLPVFGRTTLGWTATTAGASIGLIAVALLVGCLVATRVLAAGRVAAKTVALVDFAVVFAASIAMALTFNPGSGFALITGLGVLLGFAVGLGMVALSVIVQGAAPPDRTSDVSGITREGAYVAQSLGVAIAGAVMIAVLVASLNSKVNASPSLSASQKQAIVTKLDKDVEVSIVPDTRAKTVAQTNGVDQAAVGEVVKINGSSRDSALAWAILIVALCALIAFLFTLRIPAPATGSEP